MPHIMKSIPYTQEELKQMFEYKDGHLFWRIKSGKEKSTKTKKLNPSFYFNISIKNKLYLVHRVIWKLINGNDPKIIDHIDRDKFNNKIENLREVSPRENCWNRGKNKLIGAHKKTDQKRKKPYRATIFFKGKHVCIGYFETEIEAHEAYLKFITDNVKL